MKKSTTILIIAVLCIVFLAVLPSNITRVISFGYIGGLSGIYGNSKVKIGYQSIDFKRSKAIVNLNLLGISSQEFSCDYQIEDDVLFLNSSNGEGIVFKIYDDMLISPSNDTLIKGVRPSKTTSLWQKTEEIYKQEMSEKKVNKTGNKAFDYYKTGYKNYVNESGYISDKTLQNIELIADSSQTIEVKPEFPGGALQMHLFITKNINFPENVLNDQFSGTVVISCTVDIDGSLNDFNIEKSLNKYCDNESIRIVKMMPNWSAGKSLNREPISTQIFIPIIFSIK
jgi:hypothetical protein